MIAAGCGSPARESPAAAAVESFREDPVRAEEMLAGLDAVSRIKAVAQIVDEDPQSAGVLCKGLPHGVSRDRCEYAGTRVHLWSPPEDTETPARAGRGHGRSTLAPSDVPASSWAQLEVSSDASVADPQAQAWAAAVGAARGGSAEASARACAQLRGGERWRHDCFYQVATARLEQLGRVSLSEAMALCGASGPHRGQCVEALIDQLAEGAPPSSAGDAVTWAPVLMGAHSLRSLDLDEDLSGRLLDLFWARVALHSVYAAVDLSGDAFDALPRAAHPHLRSALAQRGVSGLHPNTTLAEAVGVARGVVSRRLEGPVAQFGGLPLPEIVDFWAVDGPGEAHMAAQSYLGVSRRTTANEPETDLIIAVVEAAARTQPPMTAVIQDARIHADQRVRWTAARLSDALGAEALGLAPREASQEPGAPN